jgi:hypothetical protein
MKQTWLDHCCSKPDAFEERLEYGLYRKSHTEQSLAAELGHTFDVVECRYEEHDPRYVMCVVKRKDAALSGETDAGDARHFEEPQTTRLDLVGVSVQDLVGKIKAICDILEVHGKRVSSFFDGTDDTAGPSNPLRGVDTSLSEFVELLLSAFDLLVDREP